MTRQGLSPKVHDRRADDHAPLSAVVERFTRKIENHMAAVALNYSAYNFIKGSVLNLVEK